MPENIFHCGAKCLYSLLLHNKDINLKNIIPISYQSKKCFKVSGI